LCVSLLLKSPGLRIISEVSDGLEAVERAQEQKPDLVRLDISLPTLNGVEVAILIREAAPMTKIVFISAYQDSDAVQTVLTNGADGYVLKWDITREPLPAIEAALWEGKFVTSHLTDLKPTQLPQKQRRSGALTCPITLGNSISAENCSRLNP